MANNDEPTLVTMYREPVDRCRSHWAYLHRLCKDPLKSQSDHCARMMKTYPDTAQGQLRFIQMSGTQSEGFQKWLNIRSPQVSFQWIQNNVHFWGVSDRYSLSLCLLWFQAGLTDKLNSSVCSCEAKRRRTQAGDPQVFVKHLNSAPMQKGNEARLNVSDEYIASFLLPDIELFQLLRSEFMQRVRRMEIDTGISMYPCSSS